MICPVYMPQPGLLRQILVYMLVFNQKTSPAYLAGLQM